jgi:hypothetical protein
MSERPAAVRLLQQGCLPGRNAGEVVQVTDENWPRIEGLMRKRGEVEEVDGDGVSGVGCRVSEPDGEAEGSGLEAPPTEEEADGEGEDEEGEEE